MSSQNQKENDTIRQTLDEVISSYTDSGNYSLQIFVLLNILIKYLYYKKVYLHIFCYLFDNYKSLK